MPELTVVVAGTRTEVGKTWVTAAIARGLRTTGTEVSVRKPVESYDPADRSDSEVLAEASGEERSRITLPRRRYPLAMAPPMAAAELGKPGFFISELIGELGLPSTGIALIEGVGGPRSPVASDGDTVALAEAAQADLVVLVADADLGAINDVLLGVAAFGSLPVLVFLNRFDAGNRLHILNREWLGDRAGLEVVTKIEDWNQLGAGDQLQGTGIG